MESASWQVITALHETRNLMNGRELRDFNLSQPLVRQLDDETLRRLGLDQADINQYRRLAQRELNLKP